MGIKVREELYEVEIINCLNIMNGTVQFFSLAKEISEQNDLSPKEPEKVNELLAMLHKWRTKVDAKMMQPNPKCNS